MSSLVSCRWAEACFEGGTPIGAKVELGVEFELSTDGFCGVKTRSGWFDAWLGRDEAGTGDLARGCWLIGGVGSPLDSSEWSLCPDCAADAEPLTAVKDGPDSVN